VLKIWDERGPDAPIKGGFLSPFSGKEFAMYRPAEYTSIADGWTCTGCSGALAAISEPTSVALFTTVLVTIFTMWNIIRR